MLSKLSKSEIKVLALLCKKGLSIKELSVGLDVKPSFLFRVLSSLSSKMLVSVAKRGITKYIGLSQASHAQNFKRLFESRPNVNFGMLISGSAMNILIILGKGADMDMIMREANCSKTTLYKILYNLSSAGLLRRDKERIELSDPLLNLFAESYADNMQLILQKGLSVSNSVRIRNHVIIRTDAKTVPEFFSETGITALSKEGFEANLTSYQDFYFSLNERKTEIGLEESLIHAVALTAAQQHQDMPALSLFFAKNASRFDIRALRKLAKDYSVEDELNEIRQKAEFYEKMRGFE